jgi:hypothetical protein
MAEFPDGGGIPMTSLTTPGDIAGLVLLAAAIVAVPARVTASRLAVTRPAEPTRADDWQRLPNQHPLAAHQLAQDPLAQHPLAQRVPAQRMAPRPSVPAIPAQPTWQSRAGHASRIQNLAGTRPDC